MYPELKLKYGKEIPVSFQHPWIFSGALEKIPTDLKSGSLVVVKDFPGNTVGVGTFSKHSMIAVRIFEFTSTNAKVPAEINEKWLTAKIKAANEKRKILGYGLPGSAETKGAETTAYRVVFGESDGIPGLVVDRYGDALVIQISTEGIENLKPEILEALKKIFKPNLIVERNDIQSRHEEGLKDSKGILYQAEVPAKKATTKTKTKASAKAAAKPVKETTAKTTAEVTGVSPLMIFQENGLTFEADLLAGQKTGFFLDQKDLRARLSQYAAGRKILNVFSYSGANGVYALKAKASHVTNVDSSEEALAQAENNAKLNKIPKTKFTNLEEDAFQFLGKFSDKEAAPEFDMTIIDPPALIKSHKDKEEGMKAYHFLNRAAIKATKNNGILVTSSCSHYFTEDDLALTLKKASIQSGATLTILAKVTQSPDHPISIYFPESAYLKSFICLVTRNEK